MELGRGHREEERKGTRRRWGGVHTQNCSIHPLTSYSKSYDVAAGAIHQGKIEGKYRADPDQI